MCLLWQIQIQISSGDILIFVLCLCNIKVIFDCNNLPLFCLEWSGEKLYLLASLASLSVVNHHILQLFDTSVLLITPTNWQCLQKGLQLVFSWLLNQILKGKVVFLLTFTWLAHSFCCCDESGSSLVLFKSSWLSDWVMLYSDCVLTTDWSDRSELELERVSFLKIWSCSTIIICILYVIASLRGVWQSRSAQSRKNP